MEKRTERRRTSERALYVSLRDETELGSLVVLPFKTCSELKRVMVWTPSENPSLSLQQRFCNQSLPSINCGTVFRFRFRG
ncbi:hypothetical protein FH972_009986 [Carpinus fangiana]|uniref:Uncharacterized protein n=1 Tax=Carpinus fangiana TaxID=176857 RepID=A0A660KLW7_9ROSI|nr:hypothetical protein FH972_009986 [Carpinus fangiana]